MASGLYLTASQVMMMMMMLLNSSARLIRIRASLYLNAATYLRAADSDSDSALDAHFRAIE